MSMDYDYESITFVNTIWVVKDSSTIIVESTIFFPFVFFGVFGNCLSLYALFKNPHIRTPSNLLIGNMATSDMLSLLIHPWIFVTYDIFQNYQLGPFGCRVEAAVECAILIVSVISMSAISYDRLTAILVPEESRLNKKAAKIIIFSSWISGFIISTPLFIYRTYKERQWKNFLEKYCKETIAVTNIYWQVIIIILVLLPLSIQLICYSTIYVKLSKYERTVLKRLDQHVKYKKKAALMMFCIISTFIVCRLPFASLIFYRQSMMDSTNMQQSASVQNQASGSWHTYWFISKFLIYVNAALNPLIYAVTNEKFKRAFKEIKLLKWICPRGNNAKTIVTKPKLESESNPELRRNKFFFIFKRNKPKSVTIPTVVTPIPLTKL